jgi:hypothetical protein
VERSPTTAAIFRKYSSTSGRFGAAIISTSR